MEFLCGVRALRGYRSLRDAVGSSIRLLSVLPGDLPAGIERIQTEVKGTKRELKDLQTRLASFEAAALAGRAEPHGAARVVVAALEGWDANGLKTIASLVSASPGHVAVLFGVPPPSAVVVSRAPDAAVDCAATLKALTDRFGGKGGGRSELGAGRRPAGQRGGFRRVRAESLVS